MAATLALGGCRNEFVVGVLGGADGDDDATASTSTAAADGTTTSGGGASTGTGDADTGSGGESGSESSSTGEPVECEAPSPHVPCDASVANDPKDPSHAFVALRMLGLGCPGDSGTRTPIGEAQFAWNDTTSWVPAETYGNVEFTAREGERLLVLTTGVVEHPGDPGLITVPVGQTDTPDPEGDGNGNPDNQTMLPLPIRPESGSGGTPYEDCTGVGDCSETLPDVWSADVDGADDLLWLTFSVDVPPGTPGWRVDLAWFSAEFPERVGSATNDMFVWWQSSEAFTGNVATLGGAPLTVTGLNAFLVDSGFVGDAPQLSGTGYEGTTGSPCEVEGMQYADCPRGAGTGWLTLDAAVVPGERDVAMALAIFDLGDPHFDTAVLVDRFRWSCEGCTVGDTCGLSPAP